MVNKRYEKYKETYTKGNGRNSDNSNNDMDNLQTLCLRCHGKKDIQRHGQFINKNGGKK